MNAATTKLTVKQHLQALTDEQLQQYHLTHDYFSGRPLANPVMPRQQESSAEVRKKQRDLDRMNEVLYPAPTLGCVLGDTLSAALSGMQKQSDASTEPDKTSRFTKPSEDLLNRATDWYAKYSSQGLDSVLPMQSGILTDDHLAIIKEAFSHNTLLTQNVCMLSGFWIRDPKTWDAQGHQGLFEHLFVEYEAPAFLKKCWSQVADEDNTKWLLCYLMYVQGGSLKALAQFFGWTVASHKLWHRLFEAPVSLSPQQAVLHTEFKRLGGWAEDFQCFMANPAYVSDLLEPVSSESRDFWYDTCRWTVNQQFDLSATQLTKVLWWARHQFTEFARRGDNYRLQGRSLSKVLESIAEYEQAQAEVERARARLAERARQVSMARNEARDRMREQDRLLRENMMARHNARYYYDDIDEHWSPRGWDWRVTAHGKHWTFSELTNSQALWAEGEAMDHCVGGYSHNCVTGESAIFSLKCEGIRVVTIEIDPLTRDVVQMSGYCNAEPKRSQVSVVKKWMTAVVGGHIYF